MMGLWGMSWARVVMRNWVLSGHYLNKALEIRSVKPVVTHKQFMSDKVFKVVTSILNILTFSQHLSLTALSLADLFPILQ
jgi:small-conductance mechanosensitive channel